ncbi:MAG: anaerobic sulfatase maturase [Bryobacteraceae bacterium]|nr:anaerobic sulfatase maturase [Bryobacteraceae bacterium]MDW8380403.1 anaerobic sulfatase maturase [Bryobacterales bacterium]
MANGSSLFPIYGEGLIPASLGTTPRITSLLIKPASAVCNLDCAYCFYLDREADPYKSLPGRRMSEETLERLVDTFLFYSYPNSVFAFQGGEPTLAGLPFFEKLVKFQKQYGRDGQNVSNALQTNGMLLDDSWCQLFKEYNWLIGLSLDGPEDIHDAYRFNKAGRGSWKRVMQSLSTLQKHKVDFNILCVLSQANVHRPREIYQFFKGLGVDNIQYIPLSEFDEQGNPLPFTVSAEEYGRFMVETFDLWWPDRRKIRIRFFDNIAEALAGQKPGSCTMHETCDSYVVVEYNGDIYPCDFFVSSEWRLGNLHVDSWTEIARKQRRYAFAKNKTIPHPECQVCEYQAICHGGCPKSRHAMHRNFADLDHFCQAYKMIFRKSVGPLKKEVEKILGREVEPIQFYSISPY